MAAVLGITTIRTNFTPDIVIDPAKKGVGGAILKALQPTIDSSVLGAPLHYAPWGDAAAGLGQALVFVGAALAVLGAWTLIRKVIR